VDGSDKQLDGSLFAAANRSPNSPLSGSICPRAPYRKSPRSSSARIPSLGLTVVQR
jgi:hypothetical protein